MMFIHNWKNSRLFVDGMRFLTRRVILTAKPEALRRFRAQLLSLSFSKSISNYYNEGKKYSRINFLFFYSDNFD